MFWIMMQGLVMLQGYGARSSCCEICRVLHPGQLLPQRGLRLGDALYRRSSPPLPLPLPLPLFLSLCAGGGRQGTSLEPKSLMPLLASLLPPPPALTSHPIPLPNRHPPPSTPWSRPFQPCASSRAHLRDIARAAVGVFARPSRVPTQGSLRVLLPPVVHLRCTRATTASRWPYRRS